MTILFDATRTAKPSRTIRRFGAGLLAYVPHVQHAFEPTDADWAGLRNMEETIAARRQAEADLDRRYDAEFARMDDGRWSDADQLAHHGCV